MIKTQSGNSLGLHKTLHEANGWLSARSSRQEASATSDERQKIAGQYGFGGTFVVIEFR
jgi:hypothetical protein